MSVKTSSITLSRSGESGNLCLVMEMILAFLILSSGGYRFVTNAFYTLSHIPFILLSSDLYHEGMWDFVKGLFVSIEMNM